MDRAVACAPWHYTEDGVVGREQGLVYPSRIKIWLCAFWMSRGIFGEVALKKPNFQVVFCVVLDYRYA